MATSGNSEAPTNIFKLESSPLNHASAVIEELEATSDQSEQVNIIKLSFHFYFLYR